MDLSCPSGSSVNDGINPSLASVCYASVDNAVEIIRSLGKGALLTKFDLKVAYRIVPVHPADHHKLGITREGATFVDRCLPFGLRSAPKIFSAISESLAWVFGCYGLISQVHYLDDFLFLEPPGRTSSPIISLVSSICSTLGVPLAVHKTEGPSTGLKFLGIVVDSARWELRLPDVKLELIYALIQVWSRRSSCRRKELESFLGHLSHAATVIHQGRHELFQLLSIARQSHFFIRLTRGAKADIALLPSEVEWQVLFPAAGSFGCGGFQVHGPWFQLAWPGELGRSIAALVLIPVVIAAMLWGSNWQGSIPL